MSIKSIQVHGSKIHCIDTESNSPSKPTILLVHGFPLNHAMWNKQVNVFAQHARVICPGLTGQQLNFFANRFVYRRPMELIGIWLN